MPGFIILAGFIAMTVILSCIGSYILRNKKNIGVPSKSQKRKISKTKPMTQEQIDEIHARDKITPEEKVKEWETMELCAPGDAIGSASWRCLKFNSCHECLVAYAAELNTEFESFYQNLNFHL